MKNLLLKIFLKIGGRDIFKAYKWLKNLEYNPLEQNRKIQEERLKKILLHSWTHVPYYKDKVEKAEVIVNGKIDLKNFERLPVLTKELIRNNFNELKSSDKNYKLRKPYHNTSGGTTGDPVEFIQDNDTWTQGMAAKWLFYSFITKFPCKHIKLWGSERDILKGSYGWKGTLKNWIYNREFFNSFKMTPKQMRTYVAKIKETKPKIIEAYVQSAYEVAKFAKRNNLSIHPAKGIVVSAGNLYPDMKQTIEEVFGCKTFNRYGSREVGDMACSCSKQEGLHLNILQHYLEILDENMKPVAPGKSGKVYVTTLNNFSMPLIRYEIGDIATRAHHVKCSCGRGLPLIKNIRGRDVNMFKTKKNELIDGEFFTHLFYHRDWCQKFQVVQEDYETISVKVVLAKGYELIPKIDTQYLNKTIQKVMGKNTCVQFNIVNKIEPTKEGKFLYTISKIK